MLTKIFSRRLAALASCLALAGCCANDVCNCPDTLADALYFSFQIGGVGGFDASDVDTLSIIRTTRPVANMTTPITSESKQLLLPLNSGGASLRSNSLVINNASPFTSSGSNIKLNAYDYRIVAYRIDQVAGKKVKTKYVFKITNIELDGHFKANGCCTCYENTGKTFSYNPIANDTLAAPISQDATQPPETPLTTILKKS